MKIGEKESKRGFVVAGLLLGILMASMDNTIVATAMGTIVSELGGLDQFIWVTSAYMIASVAGMPIFGKLSDMYGRKLFYVSGLTLFLVGSILCGLAQNMVQLSIFRAIQGLGSGALMPIAFTIMFDTFPPEQRGKMSGLFGAVFGISSVFGPLLGAYITDYIDWRWIFYVNVPLGLLSLLFVVKFYFESLEHREQKIDWWGAILLVSSVLCLMFALEFGGKEYAWNSATIIGLFSGFVVLLALFLWVETKAEEPIIPFHLFKKRLFSTAQGIGFLYGATFILGTIFIPIFVQGVYGGSATNSGLILTPMMLGSVVGSQIGGRFAVKTSYRNLMIISGFLLFIGIYLLSTLSADTARSLVTVYMVITGIGVGFSFPLLSMAAVHGIDMRQRGTANSTNTFFRSIGMTLGVTVYGTIQNHLLMDKLKKALPMMKQFNPSGDTRVLLSKEARAHIPPEALQKITHALADSIATMFTWAIIPVVISIILIFMMGPARLTDQFSAQAKEKHS
ncbi:MDR family MFS transporter [Thermaerobacillus caldiproteolyticus]|uniref:EmrB/QacA subfamily drug resistance transporter n=1 Tax=Thermaerobacillus caldiproteolyticus TaxID=247480 RepID=A0A7V9Z526_9BACL|nr:MDR family MFS transporter [Anoxybacillus caldiproteolyticus]MBA2874188.1 EmrB/QacA subfamily drug resistance transporter [Anoxybacillus caldiproteolyticus]